MAQPFRLDPRVTEYIIAACDDMFATALKSQRAIQESRELMVRVDALLAAGPFVPRPR
jgi:hypothetical protein